jgi:hypothetical protein
MSASDDLRQLVEVVIVLKTLSVNSKNKLQFSTSHHVPTLIALNILLPSDDSSDDNIAPDCYEVNAEYLIKNLILQLGADAKDTLNSGVSHLLGQPGYYDVRTIFTSPSYNLHPNYFYTTIPSLISAEVSSMISLLNCNLQCQLLSMQKKSRNLSHHHILLP